MPFGLVSAWNKRRRSRSLEQSDPCNLSSSSFGGKLFKNVISFSNHHLLSGTYKAIEFWQLDEDHQTTSQPPSKEADGEREFRVEVDILSRLDHPNLVTLMGYCADGKHRFLVYEFMQKGNLQDHLNGIVKEKMDWPLRLKVALEAAKGLQYLHSGTAVGIPIIHRDFKSTNILLTAKFEAKISDLGLAKLMPEGKEMCETARMLGTFGYFDPEYTSTGKLTLQSDVYAFGVVLLELLTGRRAVDLNQGTNDQNLVLQVRHILNNRKKLRKIIDPNLSQGSYTLESIAMFANLASRCVRAEGGERPLMTQDDGS